MIYTVVLDANVIYPAPIRDLLLNLADLDLFYPKWSALIHEEWIRSLLANRPDLSRHKLLRTKQLMNNAFPDAEVREFEIHIPALDLPDPNDRHILAVALQCQADAIITFNTKDFPATYLAQFDVEVYDPDRFLSLLHQFSPNTIQRAFQNQWHALKNPPVSKARLIETLTKGGLPSIQKLID